MHLKTPQQKLIKMKDGGGPQREKYLNNDWKFSKFDENRNSQIQKLNKPQAEQTHKYTKVHHSQILKLWKGKNILGSQKKKRNITYTY